MNLDDPIERDLLAAEYVLGTLRGLDRQMFDDALTRDRQLGLLVHQWEERLAGLSAAVTPVSPGPQVWQRLERSIEGHAHRHTQAPAQPGPVIRVVSDPDDSGLSSTISRLRRELFGWRIISGLAVATAALLMYLELRPLPSAPPPAAPLLAVLQPAEATGGWLIRALPERTLAQPIAEPVIAADRDFELWAVPAGAPVPVSLGLLRREGVTMLELAPDLRTHMVPGTLLAVSIEPRGGSPSVGPTGPVVFTGRVGEAQIR